VPGVTGAGPALAGAWRVVSARVDGEGLRIRSAEQIPPQSGDRRLTSVATFRRA
jgi:hypothetical protein